MKNDKPFRILLAENDQTPGNLFIEGEVATLIEAKEGEATGRSWDVVLIRPGKSKNQTYYPEAVLQKAANLFEGAPALARSDDEHSWDSNRSVKNIVGIYSEVAYREGALRGKLTILEDGAWMHNKMVEARALGSQNLFGLSIVAGGTATIKKHKGEMVRYVESIDRVSSVDPVINPAAGGRFVKLAAAENASLEGEIEMLKKWLKLIEAKRPDLLKGKDLEAITEAEIMALAGQCMLTEAEITAAKEPPKKEPEAKKVGLTEAETRLAEAEKRFTCRMLLGEKLAECKLPPATVTRIRANFDGKIFTEAELDAGIKAERDYLAIFDKSGQISGAGGPAAGGMAEQDRKKAGVLGFFMREAQKVGDELVPPYRSVKEMYQEITGDRYITGLLREATHLREMGQAQFGAMFHESMISTTLSDILYDAMHKKMIADYRMPGMEQWKLLVSDIVPVQDFRTNYRGRMGGYSDLPDVAERGDYLPLTSPGDEKASYAITKRGGTEDITIEMIANDDVGAVRKIPERLALAAKSTLFNFVMSLMTDNPTCTYDSAALFVAAGHANYSASGLSLSAASLNTIRIAMRSQTPYGQTNIPLGIVPKFLWIPNELEDLANKLCNAMVNLISNGTTENSDMPNLHHGIKPVVMDIWTDADDFYVSGPRENPMIELGFFQGREEPELFLQSAPTSGSMFLADKLTWKIRHIYGGHWLDHRNVYYSKV
jgi:hypothetical protein